MSPKMHTELQGGNGDLCSGHVLGRGILPGIPPLLERALWRLFRFDRVSGLYARLLEDHGDVHFISKALLHLNITCRMSDWDRSKIPAKGPLIVTANHPFGAVEGLILGSMLLSIRPDVKLMGNSILKHINVPEFLNTFIFVDPFRRKSSLRTNIRPLRQAVQWVRDGGALGIFPAGEVSHFHLGKGRVTDPAWNDTVAGIVNGAQASVVPVFFEGRNSWLFQAAGMLHPRMRTLMLAREIFKKEGTEIRVKVGKRIPYEKLAALPDRKAMTRYLRLRTYLLENRKEDKAPPRHGQEATGLLPRRGYPSVAQPICLERIPRYVDALPPQQMLVSAGEFSVFYAESDQIPLLLREIGRLREITFRQSGEGSGRPIDLDRFDRYYTHLFLWDNAAGQVAGAYRIGLTDRVLERYGNAGLYTRTLFRYKTLLLDRIGPALELGRSFVRREYQKSYQPLLLLWKGIGRFVAARPQYKVLFGPVSISSEYHSVSRDLIIEFSKSNRHREYARLVRGAHPVRCNPVRHVRLKAACRMIADIQDLSELVSDIERDRKGIPILLKHYLNLGGRFLGFSRDRDFSNVVDGLVMVDLTRVDSAVLRRYMGDDGAASFLAFHNAGLLTQCA